VQALTIALVQTATHWHDPEANRHMFETWLGSVPAGTGLVVLPEMFSTGFTMAARAVAEPMDGPTVRWMRDTARSLSATVCGSLVIREGRACFNRFVWMPPDGPAVTYDKRHRFRMADEHRAYAAGTQRVVVRMGEWRLLPLVCYDLRFPVWLRNRGDYDALLAVANWPAVRQIAWQTLLRARAIENLAYAVGVNVLGTDGNGVEYAGGSAVYGPEGDALLDAGSRPGVFAATLDGAALTALRARFPAWQDADAFTLDPAAP
jgi:omega-amidase